MINPPTEREIELLDILYALVCHPSISLGDLVYTVRERCDGDPQVAAWSDAVVRARKALKEAGLM